MVGMKCGGCVSRVTGILEQEADVQKVPHPAPSMHLLLAQSTRARGECPCLCSQA